MSTEAAMGWGIGSDKRQEALEMLFEGETQTAIGDHFDISRSSVKEFANHPETKASLARMGRAFEQEIARKGAHAVRGAVERTIEIAEDETNEAPVRLAANKVLMATFGFAPGRTSMRCMGPVMGTQCAKCGFVRNGAFWSSAW